MVARRANSSEQGDRDIGVRVALGSTDQNRGQKQTHAAESPYKWA